MKSILEQVYPILEQAVRIYTFEASITTDQFCRYAKLMLAHLKFGSVLQTSPTQLKLR